MGWVLGSGVQREPDQIAPDSSVDSGRQRAQSDRRTAGRKCGSSRMGSRFCFGTWAMSVQKIYWYKARGGRYSLDRWV